jgi:hypothetical protein
VEAWIGRSSELKLTLRGAVLGTLFITNVLLAGLASAADSIKGQVLGGGAPIANSAVTLWAATSAAPRQLAEANTNESGEFEIRVAETQSAAVLYLIAKGGEPQAGDNRSNKGPNPAIALMATLGTMPPKRVTINEFTSVASAWTGAQFLNDMALSGNTLGLSIAAGNVRN